MSLPNEKLIGPTALALALGGLAACSGSAGPTAAAARAPSKRALIVAIATYEPSTGWSPLGSGNDVPLIRDILSAHGFTDIQELRDAAATRQGILEAIRTRLIEPSAPGDVVVFHYSGHGQQLTDDADEEVDGYDETLVPWNAPMAPPSGYDGSKHLRDDEWGAQMDALRRKVGPSGHVLAFVDSCHSGSIPRGTLDQGVARVRGGAPPIGPPRQRTAAARGAAEGGGLFEPPRARGGGADAERDLAPIVVFSAAQHDQWAYEMPGRNVGSLSYALSGALRDAGPDTTYQVVYEDIKREMQKWVSNRPQIEGAAHAQVFSGRAVRQPPYVPVTGVQQRGARVTVGAGAVAGLLKGSEVEVHAAGTQVPGDASRLARGRVVDSQPLSATVELSPAVPEARLTGSRAFVTRYSFGDLRIRVGLREVEPAQTREAIQKHLSRVAAVELVEADPEVVVAAAAGAHALPAPLVVFAPGTGAPILGPLPATDPTTADRIANRLQDYARNQYFRRLKLRSPLLDSKLEIVPVQLDQCSDPARPTCETCRVQPQPLEGYSTPGGGLRLPVGTYIKLRVHPGRARAFNAVLDLQPDGGINVLWPVPGLQEFTAPGAPRTLDRCFQLGEPTGTEVFVLVSSDRFVDFAPFQTVESLGSRGPAAGVPDGPFAPLLNDALVRSRGAIDVGGAGNVSTDMVVFELASASP